MLGVTSTVTSAINARARAATLPGPISLESSASISSVGGVICRSSASFSRSGLGSRCRNAPIEASRSSTCNGVSSTSPFIQALNRASAVVRSRESMASMARPITLTRNWVGTRSIAPAGSTNVTLATRLASRIAELPDSAGPIDRIATIADFVLPRDDDARAAMLVYLQFAAAAMADPSLRAADAFANGMALVNVFASELSAMDMTGSQADAIGPQLQAQALMAMLLGLSMGVLVDQTSLQIARAVLRHHLCGLEHRGWD